MARDGLTDAFDHSPMGELTDRHNARLGISRAEQDEFAAQSHQRAATAIKDGLLAGEIVGVPVPQRRGEPVVFDQDEGVRPDTTAEALSAPAARVRRRRHDHGRLLLADLGRRRRRRRDVGRGGGATAVRRCWPPWARTVSWPARTRRCSPSRRPRSAARSARPGWASSDLDLIEINEAFAAVAIQSMRDLGVGDDKVNVNGGAIALGHPIGASGARIALHLVHELGRRGGGLGAAALCGGGGQGSALLFEVAAADARG